MKGGLFEMAVRLIELGRAPVVRIFRRLKPIRPTHAVRQIVRTCTLHIKFLAPLAFLSPRIVYAITNGTIPGCAKTRLETASWPLQ